jgi:hypothetical protein
MLPCGDACVAAIRTHIDGFLRFLGLEEFRFGLRELALVLERHGMLEVDVGNLVFGGHVCDVVCLHEVCALDRVVHGDVAQPTFDELFRTSLATEGQGEVERPLFVGGQTTVLLGDAQHVLPLIVVLVHAHRGGPCLRFDIVVLGGLEVAFALELLRERCMCVDQEVRSMRGHQAHHVIPSTRLAIGPDRRVGLPDGEVQLLGLLELSGQFELQALGHVKRTNILGRHVGHRQCVRLVPQGGVRVHRHGVLWHSGLHEVLLRFRVLLLFGQMLRDATEVRLGFAGIHRVQDVDGALPLARFDRGGNRLQTGTGLDVVRRGGIHLLLLNAPGRQQ